MIRVHEESLQTAPNDRLFQPFIPMGSEVSHVAKPQRFGTAVTRNVTHDTTSTRYVVRQAPYNNASGTNRWIRWYRSPYLTRATLPAGRDTSIHEDRERLADLVFSSREGGREAARRQGGKKDGKRHNTYCAMKQTQPYHGTMGKLELRFVCRARRVALYSTAHGTGGYS